MSGHAEFLVACDRGVRQAERDFARGNHTLNPFPPGATGQRAGWHGRMRELMCARDHGVGVCCQEHRQHRAQTCRSFRGLSYCAECRADIQPRMEADELIAFVPHIPSVRASAD